MDGRQGIDEMMCREKGGGKRMDGEVWKEKKGDGNK